MLFNSFIDGKLIIRFSQIILKESGEKMQVVCSIGPNIKSTKDLDKFIEAGMNSMRLNFSHPSYNKYRELIRYVKEKNLSIEIIQDLQGNKLRVSSYFKKEVKVKSGEKVYFCCEDYYKGIEEKKENNSLHIPIAINKNFSALNNVDWIFMKDGTMKFKVLSYHSNGVIEAEVVVGGIVRGKKGINAPGMDRSAMGLTSKDKSDIKYGIHEGVSVICLSYVTSLEDIEELKRYILTVSEKKVMPEIWAKIECREGIENISSIIKEVDGIMIGRGDLLSEVSLDEIPVMEDKVINLCRDNGVKVVVATYVLESMKRSDTPQLAEVEALYGYRKAGVNGIMLAGEVGIGRFPIKAIEFANRIVNSK